MVQCPGEEHSRTELDAVHPVGNTQGVNPSTQLNPSANIVRDEVPRRRADRKVANRPDTEANEQLGNDQSQHEHVQSVDFPQQHYVATKVIEMIAQQQQQTLALTLPSAKVPVFNGSPIDYQNFIQAFEHLIESKTKSDSSRL